MLIEEKYEDLTDAEANLILDLYRVIDELVYFGQPVTLVRLGYELDIKPIELSDYLAIIVSILNKVEEEYAEIRQSSN
jgi:hypothetical protein|tara:strand:- start:1519 stop:1752 length:234 start_codon:yes stop_codon:yes gene_type:complete